MRNMDLRRRLPSGRILASFPQVHLLLFPLAQLFHTRYALHKRAYQHRVGTAVELMLLEVMLLADDHLLFSGTGGALRKMSQCPSDMAAYWKLSDSVIKMIETSYSPVSCFLIHVSFVRLFLSEN